MLKKIFLGAMVFSTVVVQATGENWFYETSYYSLREQVAIMTRLAHTRDDRPGRPVGTREPFQATAPIDHIQEDSTQVAAVAAMHALVQPSPEPVTMPPAEQRPASRGLGASPSSPRTLNPAFSLSLGQ